MKKDLVFLAFCAVAAALFVTDVVFAVVYAIKASAFVSGELFASAAFLPLCVVLIVLNAVFAISAAGYFVFRHITDNRSSKESGI